MEKMEVTSKQRTHVQAAATKLEWEISNFQKLCRLYKNGSNLVSQKFSSPLVNSVEWELHVYPNGKREEDAGNVSFFLRQIGLHQGEDPIMTDFRIYARDKSGTPVSVCRDVKDFTHQQGRGKFQIPRDKLIGAVQSDGTLSLVCEVEFFPPGTKLTAEVCDASDLSKPGDSLKELMKSELFSDCCIQVGSRLIKAHRCVLGMHSQVFRQMFLNGNMLEAQNGLIDIVDSFFEPVQAMVEFMYTGSAPDVDKYPEEILALAEKYAVQTLKELCEQRLAATLDLKNICDVAGFADTYNAVILKSACIHYLSQNHKEVLKSPDWKKMKKEQPALANELLELVLSGETLSGTSPGPSGSSMGTAGGSREAGGSSSPASDSIKAEPESGRQPPRKRTRRR